MRTTGKRLPVKEMRCRDEVCFDSRSSRKTYDANLGANRIRVDDAFERDRLLTKNSVHVNNYSIYKALDARARPFVESQCGTLQRHDECACKRKTKCEGRPNTCDGTAQDIHPLPERILVPMSNAVTSWAIAASVLSPPCSSPLYAP